MRARVGDRIHIPGRTLSQPSRDGTITAVKGEQEVMLRVVWDDGTESTFLPAAGQAIIVRPASEEPEEQEPLTLGGTIRIEVSETDSRCEATCRLTTRRGVFAGTGVARRNPGDPSVPMIGEELAISRALLSLADQLSREALAAIERHEDRELHLLDA